MIDGYISLINQNKSNIKIQLNKQKHVNLAYNLLSNNYLYDFNWLMFHSATKIILKKSHKHKFCSKNIQIRTNRF